MTLFILESLEDSSHRKLFSILGTDYIMTSRAWLNLPLMMIMGIIIALLAAPADDIVAQIMIGIGYGLLMMLASFCHGLGHILSSRMVDAPVTKLIATATVYTTFYDNDNVSSREHIGRAIGGPAFNLLVGLIVLAIYTLALPSHFMLFFGIINLVFVAITITPLPSLDGAILLHELRQSK